MVGTIFCLLQGCGKDREIEKATRLETTTIETTIQMETLLDPSYLCTDAIFLEGEMVCVYLIKNQAPVSY